MKKMTILVFVLTLFSSVYAQTKLTDEQIRYKADSILVEANVLYRYEKVGKKAFELALADKHIAKKIVNLFTYQSGDTMKTIFLNKKMECIFEFLSISKNDTCIINVGNRLMTYDEAKLLSLRDYFFNQIVENKYKVFVPYGLGLDVVLLPYEYGYKLYIFNGTIQKNIIPFGNDYVFIANYFGEIISWRCFHSNLNAIYTKELTGESLINSGHNHSKLEPFITATDICIFKQYAEKCGLKEMSVYSPSLLKYFIYNIDKDEIEIID